jgi:D-3-phosphoglycerate dehydrogenase
MAVHKIYLTEPIEAAAQARLAQACPIELGDLSLSLAEHCRRVADATIILSKSDPLRIGREIMDAAPRLRHIARHGSGYNNVDVAYATARGISISYVRGVNAVAVAEYTVGLMLLAVRHLVPAVEKCFQGDPPRRQFLGMELLGKTFGIIGVGLIGREVITRVRAFGMEVLAYHPRPHGKDFSGLEMTLVPLDELLARSDIVSIHAPFSEETRNLIDRRALSLMKPSAYLMNLGRGGIVDEAALAEALRERWIAGAVLDVLANEPVSADEPLLRHQNCIILPHIATMTLEAQTRTAMMAVDNILCFCRGGRPPHLVNPEAWKAT